MKKMFFLSLLFFYSINAQTEFKYDEAIKIKSNPQKGFYWDYFLFVPKTFKHGLPLFVVPNNTGSTDDEIETHEKSALKTINRAGMIAQKLNMPILVPVFPRPKSNWQVYTHALDRDAMTTEINDLKRLDLQLIAMIEGAKEILSLHGFAINKKIIMMGFSASGMFTNRFVLLHPEIVKAAAIGSPGGLPMVPAEKFEGVPLRYPIGINDLQEITGVPFNLTELKKVNLFFFLGADDNNDSVIYRDSYEQEDEGLIMTYFGKPLQERWNVCRKIYEKENISNAKFVLYDGVGHNINEKMITDLMIFFGKAIQQ